MTRTGEAICVELISRITLAIVSTIFVLTLLCAPDTVDLAFVNIYDKVTKGWMVFIMYIPRTM